MKLSQSATRRGPVVMVLVVSAILAGCGSGSAPTVAPPTGADPGGAPATTGPIVVDGDPSGPPATGTPIATSDASVSGGVEVTSFSMNGNRYRISAGPPIRKSTINPVGSSYVTLAVTIENLSPDREEPLTDVVDTSGSENGELVPGVFFLATPASFNQQLNLSCPTYSVQPQGTCALTTGVEKDPSNSLDFNPFDPNSTQIPIGGSVTVTLVSDVIPDKLPSGADLVLDSSNILLFYSGEGGITQVPIGPG